MGAGASATANGVRPAVSVELRKGDQIAIERSLKMALDYKEI